MAFCLFARKIPTLLPGRTAVLGVALVALTAVFIPSAQAADCSKSQDGATMAVRELQSYLMVAGLSCGQSTQYNQFVNRFSGDLKANGTSLINYFSRQYGGAGKNQLNTYVTRLANDASRASMGDRQGFCREASTVFQILQGTSPGQLASYTSESAPFKIGAGSCSATRTAQK